MDKISIESIIVDHMICDGCPLMSVCNDIQNDSFKGSGTCSDIWYKFFNCEYDVKNKRQRIHIIGGKNKC